MKKILIIIVAVILLAIACYKFAPVWFAKNQSNETANWKTYTNAQYGFEFKYPNDWMIRDDSNADPNPLTKFNNVRIYPQLADNTFYFEFTSSLTQDKGLTNLKNPGADMNLAGTVWKTNRDETGLGQVKESLLLNTAYASKFYQIEAYPYDSIGTNSVLDKVLATFKFTK